MTCLLGVLYAVGLPGFVGWVVTGLRDERGRREEMARRRGIHWPDRVEL